MFERRARGEGITALCRFLEQRGVITPYGNAGWVQNSLRKVIANRAYLGEAHHGAFVNASAHPPLIDDETWLRAQQPWEAPSSRGRRPTLLGGLLRCAGCRMAMNSTAGRQGTSNAVYSCHRRF